MYWIYLESFHILNFSIYFGFWKVFKILSHSCRQVVVLGVGGCRRLPAGRGNHHQQLQPRQPENSHGSKICQSYSPIAAKICQKVFFFINPKSRPSNMRSGCTKPSPNYISQQQVSVDPAHPGRDQGSCFFSNFCFH